MRTVAFSAVTISNADAGGSLVSDAFVAKLDPTAGIPTLTNKQEVSIYPNPSTGAFTVVHAGPENKVVSVFDALGKKIFSFSSADLTIKVDVTTLPAGIYFLCVENNSGKEMRKVVIE